MMGPLIESRVNAFLFSVILIASLVNAAENNGTGGASLSVREQAIIKELEIQATSVDIRKFTSDPILIQAHATIKYVNPKKPDGANLVLEKKSTDCGKDAIVLSSYDSKFAIPTPRGKKKRQFVVLRKSQTGIAAEDNVPYHAAFVFLRNATKNESKAIDAFGVRSVAEWDIWNERTKKFYAGWRNCDFTMLFTCESIKAMTEQAVNNVIEEQKKQRRRRALGIVEQELQVHHELVKRGVDDENLPPLIPIQGDNGHDPTDYNDLYIDFDVYRPVADKKAGGGGMRSKRNSRFKRQNGGGGQGGGGMSASASFNFGMNAGGGGQGQGQAQGGLKGRIDLGGMKKGGFGGFLNSFLGAGNKAGGRPGGMFGGFGGGGGGGPGGGGQRPNFLGNMFGGGGGGGNIFGNFLGGGKGGGNASAGGGNPFANILGGFTGKDGPLGMFGNLVGGLGGGLGGGGGGEGGLGALLGSLVGGQGGPLNAIGGLVGGVLGPEGPLGAILDVAGQALGGAGDLVTGITKGVAGGLIDTVAGPGGIADLVGNVLGGITGGEDGPLNALLGPLLGPASSILNPFIDIIGSANDFVRDLPGLGLSLGHELLGGVTGIADALGVGALIDDLGLGGVLDTASGIVDSILSTGEELLSAWDTIGNSLIDGAAMTLTKIGLPPEFAKLAAVGSQLAFNSVSLVGKGFWLGWRMGIDTIGSALNGGRFKGKGMVGPDTVPSNTNHIFGLMCPGAGNGKEFFFPQGALLRSVFKSETLGSLAGFFEPGVPGQPGAFYPDDESAATKFLGQPGVVQPEGFKPGKESGGGGGSGIVGKLDQGNKFVGEAPCVNAVYRKDDPELKAKMWAPAQTEEKAPPRPSATNEDQKILYGYLFQGIDESPHIFVAEGDSLTGFFVPEDEDNPQVKETPHGFFTPTHPSGHAVFMAETVEEVENIKEIKGVFMPDAMNLAGGISGRLSKCEDVDGKYSFVLDKPAADFTFIPGTPEVENVWNIYLSDDEWQYVPPPIPPVDKPKEEKPKGEKPVADGKKDEGGDKAGGKEEKKKEEEGAAADEKKGEGEEEKKEGDEETKKEEGEEKKEEGEEEAKKEDTENARRRRKRSGGLLGGLLGGGGGANQKGENGVKPKEEKPVKKDEGGDKAGEKENKKEEGAADEKKEEKKEEEKKEEEKKEEDTKDARRRRKRSGGGGGGLLGGVSGLLGGGGGGANQKGENGVKITTKKTEVFIPESHPVDGVLIPVDSKTKYSPMAAQLTSENPADPMKVTVLQKLQPEGPKITDPLIALFVPKDFPKGDAIAGQLTLDPSEKSGTLKLVQPKQPHIWTPDQQVWIPSGFADKVAKGSGGGGGGDEEADDQVPGVAKKPVDPPKKPNNYKFGPRHEDSPEMNEVSSETLPHEFTRGVFYKDPESPEPLFVPENGGEGTFTPDGGGAPQKGVLFPEKPGVPSDFLLNDADSVPQGTEGKFNTIDEEGKPSEGFFRAKMEDTLVTKPEIEVLPGSMQSSVKVVKEEELPAGHKDVAPEHLKRKKPLKYALVDIGGGFKGVIVEGAESLDDPNNPIFQEFLQFRAAHDGDVNPWGRVAVVDPISRDKADAPGGGGGGGGAGGAGPIDGLIGIFGGIFNIGLGIIKTAVDLASGVLGNVLGEFSLKDWEFPIISEILNGVKIPAMKIGDRGNVASMMDFRMFLMKKYACKRSKIDGKWVRLFSPLASEPFLNLKKHAKPKKAWLDSIIASGENLVLPTVEGIAGMFSGLFQLDINVVLPFMRPAGTPVKLGMEIKVSMDWKAGAPFEDWGDEFSCDEIELDQFPAAQAIATMQQDEGVTGCDLGLQLVMNVGNDVKYSDVAHKLLNNVEKKQAEKRKEGHGSGGSTTDLLGSLTKGVASATGKIAVSASIKGEVGGGGGGDAGGKGGGSKGGTTTGGGPKGASSKMKGRSFGDEPVNTREHAKSTPGWKTQYISVRPNATLAEEGVIFYGLGNCEQKDVPDLGMFKSGKANQVLDYFLKVLRIDCMEDVTDKVRKLYNSGFVTLSEDRTYFEIPETNKEVRTQKLTTDETMKLSLAFELYSVSKTYSLLRSTSDTKTTGVIEGPHKTISRSTQFLTELAMLALSKAKLVSPEHAVRLTRNLLANLRTVLTKLQQDSIMLEKCSGCVTDKLLTDGDKFRVSGLIQFIIHGLGPAENGEKPYKAAFTDFVKINKEAVEQRVKEFERQFPKP